MAAEGFKTPKVTGLKIWQYHFTDKNLQSRLVTGNMVKYTPRIPAQNLYRFFHSTLPAKAKRILFLIPWPNKKIPQNP